MSASDELAFKPCAVRETLDMEGSAVGAGVGTRVGLGVGGGTGVGGTGVRGRGVGSAVGTRVGAEVGTAVGATVGTRVGTDVGSGEGDVVGTSVAIAPPRRAETKLHRNRYTSCPPVATTRSPLESIATSLT